MSKILLTGGHAGTTALCIIKEIRSRGGKNEIYWIGPKKAVSGSTVSTIEYKIYPKLDVKYYSVEAGKVQTKFTRHTIPLLLKLPLGFLKAILITIKIRPNVILSFGGSISVPVTLTGKLLGIPIIVHEQTSTVGRANQFTSKIADVVAISRESSRKFFKNKNITLTGNPIAPEVLQFTNKNVPQKINTILITGGSRGSTWINNAFAPIAEELSKKFKIYWQAGEGNVEDIKITNKNIKIFGQVDPSEMIKIISDSDMVIGRAGANTISELIALRKPAILIPIPWSYMDEQTQNAMYMVSLGTGRIMPQKDLDSSSLLKKINELVRDYSQIRQNLKSIKSEDIHSSKKLTDIILSKI